MVWKAERLHQLLGHLVGDARSIAGDGFVPFSEWFVLSIVNEYRMYWEC